ncbi:MAG TPA: ATP-binding protein [Planctomycetota bacterium]|nr:ATP-binding protein [Planctomycetota bacterium]
MTTPLARFVDEEERLEGGAKALAVLRLALAVLAIGVTLAMALAGTGTEAAIRLFGLHPVYSAAVAVCALDVAYMILLGRARGDAGRTAMLAAAGIGLDILVASALICLTGGYSSPYLPLVFVWVIAAGTVLSGRAAFAAASLAVVFLSAASLLRHFGVIPGSLPGGPEEGAELWRAGAFHLAQAGAFFLVAALAGALSKRLAAARLLADEILASITEGLLVIDGRGRISYANREAERLLGVRLPSGEALPAQATSAPLAGVLGLLSGARDSLSPRLVDLPAGPGGPPSAISVSGAAIRDGRGAFRGLIAVVSDRSAEKALEAATRLAEQRRRLGELAMSIAHEIRNPLAAIRGAAQEIGREKGISTTGRELTDVVVSESDRLDRIVTDFLTFARPRPPLFARVDLHALAAEALDLLGRGLGPGKRVELINDVPPGTLCQGDADQLRQALLNLGLNGIAAAQGQGRLRVSARRATLEEFLAGMASERRARQPAPPASRQGSAGYCLEVADDGAGMDLTTLSRAGEPFFTTRPDGTGLGLAIVERVAAAHNGAVNITSAPGRGTAVTIWLAEHLEK